MVGWGYNRIYTPIYMSYFLLRGIATSCYGVWKNITPFLCRGYIAVYILMYGGGCIFIYCIIHTNICIPMFVVHIEFYWAVFNICLIIFFVLFGGLNYLLYICIN